MNIKREVDVALSTKTQPVWFRAFKWALFVGLGFLLYNTRYFWYLVVGVPVFGVIMHSIYRWKTKGWTRSWGGWKYYK
jgi:hypothetical protein